MRLQGETGQYAIAVGECFWRNASRRARGTDKISEKSMIGDLDGRGGFRVCIVVTTKLIQGARYWLLQLPALELRRRLGHARDPWQRRHFSEFS